ncbi:uncharacterized protein LOC125675464 [Ostrea edulis]|uniref:uncharacterized protein LOC125675464 n=1 Tax=Ostrea edulis TaxID=37623 RepID=UPI0020963A46|nr:uncharacterized protein LOC125675464 [Ostrea edulis]
MEKMLMISVGVFGVLCFLPFGDLQTTDWCKDAPDLNCWRYIDEKCIGAYEAWAREHCPYRCGYCPNKPPCVDTDTACAAYIKHDHSACSNPTTRAFMRENCRQECHLCHIPGEHSSPNTPPPGTPVPTDGLVKPAVG